MSFVVYFFVLLITVGSVMFGLDWMKAPMSPMPASQYELRAAKEPEKPKPVAVSKPEPKAAPNPAQASVQQPQAAPVVAAPAPAPEPVAAAPQPKCDIAACQAAYFTFTASDCTYQPTDGPRRLCTKGRPPAASAAAAPAPDARAQAACNIAACSQAYVSFNPTDCTYQPFDGPRQLCTK